MAQNLGGEGSDGAMTWDSDGQGEKCHALPRVSSLQYQGGRKSLSLPNSSNYLEAAGRQAPLPSLSSLQLGAPRERWRQLLVGSFQPLTAASAAG